MSGGIAGCILLAMVAGWAYRHNRLSKFLNSAARSGIRAERLPPPQATIRALIGSTRQPYVDRSGMTWAVGNYCQGGENVSVPSQKIVGTEDAPIYFGGMRGIAHCIFPVTQKFYELHFHFAETSDLPPATRLVGISVNAGPAIMSMSSAMQAATALQPQR
jgi:hypothetical protein